MGEPARRVETSNPEERARVYLDTPLTPEFEQLLERARRGERIILTQPGKADVVLLSGVDLEEYEAYEDDEDAYLGAQAEAAKQQMEDAGERGIPLAEVLAKLNLPAPK